MTAAIVGFGPKRSEIHPEARAMAITGILDRPTSVFAIPLSKPRSAMRKRGIML